MIESFNLGDSLLVLFLSLRLHLNDCLLRFFPETDLKIDHVLTSLLDVASVTVDFSVVFLYDPVQMSNLVLEFCNFILSLYQLVAEALTTLHSVLILLLLLMKVLPHALA